MDHNELAVGIFNSHAKEYAQQFMDVSLYHEVLDIFCNSIKKENPSILEIACGPGNVTKYLLKQRPDFQILATDLSENMLAEAAANNPGCDFIILDARKITTLNKFYDGIICSFCLPYLKKTEVEQLIKDCSQLLNANGLLYLSTMEDDYSKSGIKTSSGGESIFMYYYQCEYLTTVLLENGFSILHSRRISYNDRGNEVTDLILIAEKK
jgi:ubiquinone/menaquinone biosynthesis C-methylase UbiE